MGEITEYEYDSRGLLTKIIQYDGEHGTLETVLAYDAIGRLVSEVTPGGAATQYTYTDAGKLETVTDATNHTLYYETNPNGFVEEAYEYIDNVEVSTYTAYGAMSQVASQADALGNTTTYEYDKNGQMAAAVDPLGYRTEYGYDETGCQVTVTSFAGTSKEATTTSVYNEAGQLESVENALGQTTVSYTYDYLGNVLSTTEYPDPGDPSQNRSTEWRII